MTHPRTHTCSFARSLTRSPRTNAQTHGRAPAHLHIRMHQCTNARTYTHLSAHSQRIQPNATTWQISSTIVGSMIPKLYFSYWVFSWDTPGIYVGYRGCRQRKGRSARRWHPQSPMLRLSGARHACFRARAHARMLACTHAGARECDECSSAKEEPR